MDFKVKLITGRGDQEKSKEFGAAGSLNPDPVGD